MRVKCIAARRSNCHEPEGVVVSEQYLITAIEKAAKRGRIAVFVDGEPVLDVPKAFFEKLGLLVGQSLLPEQQTSLRQAAALQETRTAAVRALGRRARTRADLQRRLLARDLPHEAVTETLEWLTDRGYLDDEQYTRERWVALQQRKLGAQAIYRKLLQEGVPREVADAAMGRRTAELNETELVRDLAYRRNEQLGKLPWLQRRNRIYGYLSRRGFGHEAIAEALTRLDLDEASVPEADFAEPDRQDE